MFHLRLSLVFTAEKSQKLLILFLIGIKELKGVCALTPCKEHQQKKAEALVTSWKSTWKGSDFLFACYWMNRSCLECFFPWTEGHFKGLALFSIALALV